jgi:hypothetical protein
MVSNMMTRSTFETIKQKHGRYASWAVWGPNGATPKSGMADMSVFETDAVVNVLKPNVVMLALNFSKMVEQSQPFHNFHVAKNAQDYKIRYAFTDTEYYGAYMTDIIKDLAEMDCSKATKHLDAHPELLAKSLRIFREEMKDLGNERPVILAFGNDAYRIAHTHLRPEEYSLLVKLTHYSDYRLNKEAYKKRVFEEIAAHRESSANEHIEGRNRL